MYINHLLCLAVEKNFYTQTAEAHHYTIYQSRTQNGNNFLGSAQYREAKKWRLLSRGSQKRDNKLLQNVGKEEP